MDIKVKNSVSIELFASVVVFDGVDGDARDGWISIPAGEAVDVASVTSLQEGKDVGLVSITFVAEVGSDDKGNVKIHVTEEEGELKGKEKEHTFLTGVLEKAIMPGVEMVGDNCVVDLFTL